MIQPLWGNNRWGANGNSEVRIREDSERREKVAKVTAWISLSVTSWLKSYHTGPSSEQLKEIGWNCLYAVLFPSKYIYAESVGLCVSVGLCTCVCGYPCVYMHVCMSLYPYVHICVSWHIFVYLCRRVCMSTLGHACGLNWFWPHFIMIFLDVPLLTLFFLQLKLCIPARMSFFCL